MAFIDDMLVETEIEKEYDEIVEEMLKRLEENDLYIKPKNYVWKVRSDSQRLLQNPMGQKQKRKKWMKC